MGKKIRIIQLSEFSRSEPTHVNKFLGLKKKKGALSAPCMEKF